MRKLAFNPRRVALLLGFALTAVTCAPAAAQSARSYAVMSLSADKIFMVAPQMTTGSRLDRNLRNSFPTSDDGLEVVAVQAAAAAIKQHEANASIELYVTRDPKIYDELGAEDGTVDLGKLLTKLKGVVADSKASHLLLITRHRDTARFPLAEGYKGVGRVYGVGFYVDEEARLQYRTGEFRRGFVGPYAALKVQLIELATARTAREDIVLASEMFSGALTAESAWKGMSTADKSDALQRMIKQAVDDGVTRVLKAP
ncbi:MAG TPA: hypothetical protein VFY73_07275 [Ideonella sp.]|uniref:hypothetical protein n=1 Tax=Ideonella sp. TaxID=1929293 RepID=UPI002E320C59|nr:hypothetical protein [Ideonella sp.]HEX5683821.1 hypothetical protein [Ideonella sp.]